uniref:Venom CUB domain protein 4 n=1 Tax=Ectomocoris sp. TaxID=3104572 RepID=A0AB38ZED7_9HEMI
MKIILGLTLLSVISTGYCFQSHASAYIRGNPVRHFLQRWHPKGLQPHTDFTYDIKTDEGMIIELHCPYISLHMPCEEYYFKIIDGPHEETICGKTKKYKYLSKTNFISMRIITGPKLLKGGPKCSARPIKA